MKKNIFIILSSFLFAVYDVGDFITTSDQNVTLEVCDENSNYSIGDPIKLADWNGDLNGGDYKVIWLELSASW